MNLKRAIKYRNIYYDRKNGLTYSELQKKYHIDRNEIVLASREGVKIFNEIFDNIEILIDKERANRRKSNIRKVGVIFDKSKK